MIIENSLVSPSLFVKQGDAWPLHDPPQPPSVAVKYVLTIICYAEKLQGAFLQKRGWGRDGRQVYLFLPNYELSHGWEMEGGGGDIQYSPP